MKNRQKIDNDPKAFFLQFKFIKWFLFIIGILFFVGKFTNTWFTFSDNVFSSQSESTNSVGQTPPSITNNYIINEGDKIIRESSNTVIENSYETHNDNSNKQNKSMPKVIRSTTKPLVVEKKKCNQKGSIQINNKPAKGAKLVFDDDETYSTYTNSAGKFSFDLPQNAQGKQKMLNITYNNIVYEVNKKICFDKLNIKL